MLSFRASAHTGVGISLIYSITLQEIATPACGLVRNDMLVFGAQKTFITKENYICAQY